MYSHLVRYDLKNNPIACNVLVRKYGDRLKPFFIIKHEQTFQEIAVDWKRIGVVTLFAMVQ